VAHARPQEPQLSWSYIRSTQLPPQQVWGETQAGVHVTAASPVPVSTMPVSAGPVSATPVSATLVSVPESDVAPTQKPSTQSAPAQSAAL